MLKKIQKLKAWVWYLLVNVLILIALAPKLLNGDVIFEPGPVSPAHHQLEKSCKQCHTSVFSNRENIQQACLNCHAHQLNNDEDSHKKSKFTDPRNIDRIAKIDATLCVTCHAEHDPQIKTSSGIALPGDYCMYCHKEIATERASHENIQSGSCANVGCHNYHDNRALYEQFISKHLDEPKTLGKITQLSISTAEIIVSRPTYPSQKHPIQPLLKPDGISYRPNFEQEKITEWRESSHAKNGVNCTACHLITNQTQTVAWTDKPNEDICKTCHDIEFNGFIRGKHGMRIQSHQGYMEPNDARIKMKSKAKHKELTCNTCHGGHKYDVTYAATDACLECHEDKHSIAFKKSAHGRYIAINSNINITCATCHMPRQGYSQDNIALVLVNHNQNENLRPRTKMVRDVCMHCHGYEFSIDSLADEKLIINNFNSEPDVHNASADMVRKRIHKH